MDDKKRKWVNDLHHAMMLPLTSAQMIEFLDKAYDIAVMHGVTQEIKDNNEKLCAELAQLRGIKRQAG